MKLQIDIHTQIKDAQKKFREVYPFLKLEFSKNPHSENELSQQEGRLTTEKIISEVKQSFKPGSIDINKHRTAIEGEKDFYEKFGVASQVSRKLNKTWIETSLTDDRTLEMQNQQEQMLVINGQVFL